MEHIPVPDRAIAARPYAIPVTIGPPPGVSRHDCGDAEVLVDNSSQGDGMGYTFRAYFKPTEVEIAKLAEDGYIEIHLRGGALVPFGATIF